MYARCTKARIPAHLFNEERSLWADPAMLADPKWPIHASQKLKRATDDSNSMHKPCSWVIQRDCIETVINAAPESVQASYYRSSADAAIDLVLEMPRSDIWAVEVNEPKPQKSGAGLTLPPTILVRKNGFWLRKFRRGDGPKWCVSHTAFSRVRGALSGLRFRNTCLKRELS